MTKLLEEALAVVGRLPAAIQDQVARAMLSIAEQDACEEIDATHLPAVLEGLGQLRRGEHAGDADMVAIFRSFDE